MSVKTVSRSGDAGFSLVEIAIVIVIAGLLLSLFTGSLMTLVKNSKVKTTQTRLTEINETIRAYASSNNRLPCAASWSDAVNSVNYAKEVSCTAAAAGTQRSSGVRMGMVPTRTLNLPDEYGYDAWGGRFVYAVTEALADTDTYNLSAGDIEIVATDETTSLVTPSGSGTYLVLSLGEDNGGAYNADGVEIIGCGTGLDDENCDWDNRFIDSYYNSDTSGASQFDDNLIYSGNFQASSLIPAGAIMAFNLASCPPGWMAVPGTVGRFIIGAGNNYNETAPPSGTTVFAPRNYAVEATGGHITRFAAGATSRYENAPPYIAYTYCEKK